MPSTTGMSGNEMIEVAERYLLDVASPTPIASARQHEEYLSVLEKLAEKAKPTGREEQYAELLITLIEAYEEKHDPVPDASPIEVLKALMDANSLRQKDLASTFGSESIVSEVLSGKRELNRGQIAKLSKRFGVSPAVFF